jgi:hypothetical protein
MEGFLSQKLGTYLLKQSLLPGDHVVQSLILESQSFPDLLQILSLASKLRDTSL